ncbi:hypothetical protein F5Y15DRAFT_421260 [Xylariaceae sp. FL0016]|nr:hypothetical protein F5Y15DRAFT_421260 [Xylariaceae sp. FL0016]
MPMLRLHIVNYLDATIVSITYPRVMTDANGFVGLLQAWSVIIRQRVPQPHMLRGIKEDAIGKFIERRVDPLDTYILESEQLIAKPADDSSTFDFLRFLFNMVEGPRYDIDCYHEQLRSAITAPTGELQLKTIFFPQQFIAGVLNPDSKPKWYTSRRKGVTRRGLEAANRPNKSDMLLAWLVKTIMTCHKSQKGVLLQKTLPIRRQYNNICGHWQSGKYVQNLDPIMSISLTATDTRRMCISKLAAKIAAKAREQCTVAQTQTLVHKLRRSLDTSGKYPQFGSTDSLRIAVDDDPWMERDFYNALDFRVALIKGGPTQEGTGLCDYFQVMPILDEGISSRFNRCFTILGADRNGNYWLSGFLEDGIWRKLEDDLKKRVASPEKQ